MSGGRGGRPLLAPKEVVEQQLVLDVASASFQTFSRTRGRRRYKGPVGRGRGGRKLWFGARTGPGATERCEREEAGTVFAPEGRRCPSRWRRRKTVLCQKGGPRAGEGGDASVGRPRWRKYRAMSPASLNSCSLSVKRPMRLVWVSPVRARA